MASTMTHTYQDFMSWVQVTMLVTITLDSPAPLGLTYCNLAYTPFGPTQI